MIFPLASLSTSKSGNPREISETEIFFSHVGKLKLQLLRVFLSICQFSFSSYRLWQQRPRTVHREWLGDLKQAGIFVFSRGKNIGHQSLKWGKLLINWPIIVKSTNNSLLSLHFHFKLPLNVDFIYSLLFLLFSFCSFFFSLILQDTGYTRTTESQNGKS